MISGDKMQGFFLFLSSGITGEIPVKQICHERCSFSIKSLPLPEKWCYLLMEGQKCPGLGGQNDLICSFSLAVYTQPH